MSRCIRIACLSLFAILVAGLCILFHLITCGCAMEVLRRFLVRPASRLSLRILGIEVEILGKLNPFTEPCFYTANHTSSLDVLVAAALDLPNTRFFMSRSTLPVLPVTFVNISIGTFFLSEQDQPHRRVEEFKRASAVLLKTGESAFLNPEGIRNRSGTIGKFNRATFHMATLLKRPIVPLYFEVSSAADPGMALIPRAGSVRVHVMEAVDTSGWELTDINVHAAVLQKTYREFQSTLLQSRISTNPESPFTTISVPEAMR